MGLTPRWFHNVPSEKEFFNYPSLFDKTFSKWPSLFEESAQNGLEVSSDDKNFYVEAHVPGLSNKEVEVSIDEEGGLWIHGERKEETKDKGCRYYHKSQKAFSYFLTLGSDIDLSKDPKAVCKDGVMKLTFAKKKEKQKPSKKIEVKSS